MENVRKELRKTKSSFYIDEADAEKNNAIQKMYTVLPPSELHSYQKITNYAQLQYQTPSNRYSNISYLMISDIELSSGQLEDLISTVSHPNYPKFLKR